MHLDNPAADLQPTLIGAHVLLRPLLASDLDALHLVASDPLIWQQHPDPNRWQREVFANNFFSGAIACKSAFAILDRLTNTMIGSSRYYEVDLAKRELSIGYTFLARQFWGGVINGELKQLMLRHAFTMVDTVWFHVGASNWRSRRALAKIGAELVLETDRPLNGVPTPYAYYRIQKADFFTD